MTASPPHLPHHVSPFNFIKPAGYTISPLQLLSLHSAIPSAILSSLAHSQVGSAHHLFLLLLPTDWPISVCRDWHPTCPTASPPSPAGYTISPLQPLSRQPSPRPSRQPCQRLPSPTARCIRSPSLPPPTHRVAYQHLSRLNVPWILPPPAGPDCSRPPPAVIDARTPDAWIHLWR